MAEHNSCHHSTKYAQFITLDDEIPGSSETNSLLTEEL